MSSETWLTAFPAGSSVDGSVTLVDPGMVQPLHDLAVDRLGAGMPLRTTGVNQSRQPPSAPIP